MVDDQSSPETPINSSYEGDHSRRDFLKYGIAGAGALALLPARNLLRSGSPSAGLSASPSGALDFVDAGSYTQTPAQKAAYTAFGKRYGKVKLAVDELSSTLVTWDAQCRTRISSGVETDLLMLNGQFVAAFARDNLVYPLSAFSGLSSAMHEASAPVVNVAAYEGVPYALPLAATGGYATTVLWYNAGLTKSAGVSGSPASLQQLKAMVPRLEKMGASPMVHPAGTEDYNQLLVMWILPQVVGGDNAITYVLDTMRGLHKYTDAPWVEMWSIMDDLVKSKVMLPGSGSITVDALPEIMFTGRAATTYSGSWELAALTATANSGAIKGYDLQLGPLPVLVPGASPRTIIAYAGYAIPQSSKNPDAAVALINYMAQASVDRQITAATQALSPVRSSSSAITNPLTRAAEKYYADAITPMDWLWEPELSTAIGTQAQAIFLGNVTPKEAANTVQSAFQTLVKTGKSFFKQ
jgi:ABC-type glycerol-3-phosphate transport system substrate-binding protein